jgi:hypothetical protein
MAATGWAYVPANCASGSQCKVHVALHGCQQSTDKIGDKFVKNTGYSRWADTNSIIVLFPQTKVDNTSRSTSASGSLANPNACWDWIGWYGTNFAQKAGTQMAAIKAMVDRVSSGSGSGGGGGGGTTTLAAPTGVATSNATTTHHEDQLERRQRRRQLQRVPQRQQDQRLPVTATSFTDTGLAAATSTAGRCAPLDAGRGGRRSAAATGTTTGHTAAARHLLHVQQLRAHHGGPRHQSGGYTYAKGSNQNMGLWNTFTTTTLKMTGTNYYVIGTCP